MGVEASSSSRGSELIRQAISLERVGDRFAAADCRTAGCGNDNVLFAVLSHIRHGCGMPSGGKIRHPQFFARLRVECAEFIVVGGSDKNQTAGGSDAAAEVSSSALQSNLA